VAEGVGGGRPAQQPEGAEQAVAQGRQCLGCAADPHLTGVFPERHNEDVVDVVLDGPVAAGGRLVTA
jgi:hypothetical protein